MLDLRVPSSSHWLQAVVDHFDEFLLDHAACERKASGNALSLVAHYPDRLELVSEMIQLAREELDHFGQVYEVIAARGLQLAPDRKDAYLRALRRRVRNGREHYFLDRLLIAGIAEARGCEPVVLPRTMIYPGMPFHALPEVHGRIRNSVRYEAPGYFAVQRELVSTFPRPRRVRGTG